MWWLIGYGVWTVFKVSWVYFIFKDSEDFTFFWMCFVPILGEMFLIAILCVDRSTKEQFLKAIRIVFPFLLFIPKCKMGIHEYENTNDMILLRLMLFVKCVEK